MTDNIIDRWTRYYLQCAPLSRIEMPEAEWYELKNAIEAYIGGPARSADIDRTNFLFKGIPVVISDATI